MTEPSSPLTAPASGPGNPPRWPSLPQGVKNGVSGRIGARILVGLGSAGTALYGLDLDDRARGWISLAPFPGPVTDGAASAVVGGKLYVFSGAGKERPEDAAPVVLTSGHVYDPALDLWRKLDTETPVGLLGAVAHGLDDDRIAFFGGYNKARFDTYLRELQSIDQKAEPEKWQALVESFMGMQPQDYQWNAEVLVYSVSGNVWSSLGANGLGATTGSALVRDGDRLSLINGEIKPGLRTAAIAEARLTDGGLDWTAGAPLPPRDGDTVQEGLAGAFAGVSNGALIVAGGVNFAGSQANAANGNWYAHKGLTKIWHSDIYARQGGVWKLVGQLPAGLAYGASFTTDEGILLVGGEAGGMVAQTGVHLIRWTGSEIEIA